MTPIFGFPIYKSLIAPYKFDKQNIVNDILSNYNLNKNRNNWNAGDYLNSELHQSNSDENNPNFKKINFSKILPLYEEKTKEYLNFFNFTKDADFEVKVINYTCMTSSQYLQSHVHQDCDFTAVHYIKFNENLHSPTVYENKNFLTQFINKINPGLYKSLDKKNILNSWCFEHFSIPVMENDICFIPSCLNHFVPKQKSEETRITIAMDIRINSKDNGTNKNS